jgi:hypothetical protein
LTSNIFGRGFNSHRLHQFFYIPSAAREPYLLHELLQPSSSIVQTKLLF